MWACLVRHCWKYYEEPSTNYACVKPAFRKCIRCGQREKNYGTDSYPKWKRTDWRDEDSLQGQNEAQEIERFLQGDTRS